jgi:hypothetical protein
VASSHTGRRRDGAPRPRPQAHRAWILASVLLLIGVLGTLVVPIYARSSPEWGPFPFFYWYQLIWVPVVAVLSGLAYVLTKPPSQRAGSGQDAGRPSSASEAGDAR